MSTQALKNKYPHLHNWLQDSQIELGYGEYDHVFIRITDAGGTIWESGNNIQLPGRRSHCCQHRYSSMV
ncbi:hypothetical protein [Alkanindiges hydrocarboniclasticus]|uniref:hypothetical protein n=1 Tax=Alkanindiges hydrocarboniclasticus TaxID=1907941 RepID=UPI00117894DE|nr:hypothetical protein [Alkanindiges hydrocarboniclasticus]